MLLYHYYTVGGVLPGDPKSTEGFEGKVPVPNKDLSLVFIVPLK